MGLGKNEDAESRVLAQQEHWRGSQPIDVEGRSKHNLPLLNSIPEAFPRCNESWSRDSSHIDWCEGNYEKSSYIAEYYNTWSNVLFFIIPPIMMRLSQPFARYIDPDIHVIWLLLIGVGIGSGYFHATLSLSGQLIDELAILWVLLASFSISIPRQMLHNRWFRGSRRRLKLWLGGLAFIGSGLALIYPVINAILLMFVVIPIFYLVGGELRRCQNWAVLQLFATSSFWWLVAITCWINDRFFCELWKSFGVPYPQLHSFWHLLIVLASYSGIVVTCYFQAVDHRPDLYPRLCYWPSCLAPLAMPYIGFQTEGDGQNDTKSEYKFSRMAQTIQ
jgi:alkaline ceramidase